MALQRGRCHGAPDRGRDFCHRLFHCHRGGRRHRDSSAQSISASSCSRPSSLDPPSDPPLDSPPPSDRQGHFCHRKVDSMDAFAVKQACKFAKEHALKNGPPFYVFILSMSSFLIELASCFFQFWFFNRLNIILVVTGAMHRKYKISTDNKEAYNSILLGVTKQQSWWQQMRIGADKWR
ncbi:uncharacterized protein LOC130779968 [Actinidia eriantha]|uniref:uncharacterized protein LOC130779968 n=1 Tax=Actinidia eriantha TaxID=165200 RepID=UPI0025846928|nr:uncharacterized protein LOC130779968 [Actinidia eriantha]